MTERLDYAKVAPDAMKVLAGVRIYVAHSGLPTPLIDLVYLRVSQINGCAYCIDSHSHDLLRHGMALEKVLLVPVWEEVEGVFDSRERAALAWAETVTQVADNHIPDQAYADAAAVFDAKELTDLTVAIGLMNAYNRLAIGFRSTPPSLRAK